MHLAAQAVRVSRKSLWTGRVITGLVVLFMVFDGATKVMKEPHVIAASVQLGFSVGTVVWIGAVLLVCTAIYAIPQSSILGAILLTGYLGGAVATNVHAGTALFNISFPVIFGVLVWAGIYFRDDRLQTLIPLRR